MNASEIVSPIADSFEKQRESLREAETIEQKVSCTNPISSSGNSSSLADESQPALLAPIKVTEKEREMSLYTSTTANQQHSLKHHSASNQSAPNVSEQAFSQDVIASSSNQLEINSALSSLLPLPQPTLLIASSSSSSVANPVSIPSFARFNLLLP